MYDKRRVSDEFPYPVDAHLPAPRLRARVVARRATAWREWDAFAERSGGSIVGAYHHMIGWAARHRFSQRLTLIEITAETAAGPHKVGQCALAAGRDGRRRFLDGIQLANGYEALWGEAMAAVLRAAGPGAYEYGGEWSLEPDRNEALSDIRGVGIETVRPLVVQAVDFDRWSSWEDYYRGVVGNVRRAATAAPRRYPDLEMAVRTGRRAVAGLPDLGRLRVGVAERKRLMIQPMRFLLGRIAMTLSCSRYVVSGVAHADGLALGAFYGAEFGGNTYYLDGASAAQNTGASWRLLFTMMERAFARAPHGKFVMGYVDYALHDESRGGGLLRSRRACRVSDYPTSVVRFRYED